MARNIPLCGGSPPREVPLYRCRYCAHYTSEICDRCAEVQVEVTVPADVPSVARLDVTPLLHAARKKLALAAVCLCCRANHARDIHTLWS